MTITKFPKYNKSLSPDVIRWDDIKDEIGAMSLDQYPDEILDSDFLLQGFISLPFVTWMYKRGSEQEIELEEGSSIPFVCFISEKGLAKLIPLKTLMPHLECFENDKEVLKND